MKNIPIGQVLKEKGYITEEQIEKALSYQKDNKGKRLGAVLIELGFVTESQMLTALCEKLGLEILPIETFPIDLEAVKKIPRQLAAKYCLLAVSVSGNRLKVVTNDPLNFYAIEDIRLITGMTIDVTLAEREQIEKAIEVNYSEIEAKQVANTANTIADATIVSLGREAQREAEAGDDQQPVIRLLNSLLIRGFNTNASDIHIEPFENETRVRMRIDGMLIDYLTLARTLHPSLIARTKIMSNLDIAEKRLPQDGHFKATIDGVDLNVRVSVIPTIYGEKAVLRYLTSSATIDHSDQFGMEYENYMKFIGMLNNPHGIIYITGPTGSGKTTTLYMALEHLCKKPVNISTIEDPVERNIANVNQMQVNAVAGLSFEQGLRALLRQDPDIIMVGETRDSETASISVRAAITGHLVLSTLHTNDAISSIVRLADMGVEPYMTANSLVGVMAQRLMRKVCPHCKKSYDPSDLEQKLLHNRATTLYKGEGCHACNYTGYKGRIAIHEVLPIDRTVKRMISEKQPIDNIYRYAQEELHFQTLVQSAEELVLQGITTTDELYKLTYFVN